MTPKPPGMTGKGPDEPSISSSFQHSQVTNGIAGGYTPVQNGTKPLGVDHSWHSERRKNVSFPKSINNGMREFQSEFFRSPLFQKVRQLYSGGGTVSHAKTSGSNNLSNNVPAQKLSHSTRGSSQNGVMANGVTHPIYVVNGNQYQEAERADPSGAVIREENRPTGRRSSFNPDNPTNLTNKNIDTYSPNYNQTSSKIYKLSQNGITNDEPKQLPTTGNRPPIGVVSPILSRSNGADKRPIDIPIQRPSFRQNGSTRPYLSSGNLPTSNFHVPKRYETPEFHRRFINPGQIGSTISRPTNNDISNDHFANPVSNGNLRSNGVEHRRAHSEDTDILLGSNDRGRAVSVKQRNLSIDPTFTPHSPLQRRPFQASQYSPSPSPPLRRPTRRRDGAFVESAPFTSKHYSSNPLSVDSKKMPTNDERYIWQPDRFFKSSPNGDLTSNGPDGKFGSHSFDVADGANANLTQDTAFSKLNNYQASVNDISNPKPDKMQFAPRSRLSTDNLGRREPFERNTRFALNDSDYDNDSDIETLQDRFQRDWESFYASLPRPRQKYAIGFPRKYHAPHKMESPRSAMLRAQHLSRSEGDLVEAVNGGEDLGLRRRVTTPSPDYHYQPYTSTEDSSSDSSDEAYDRNDVDPRHRIYDNGRSLSDGYVMYLNNNDAPVKRRDRIASTAKDNMTFSPDQASFYSTNRGVPGVNTGGGAIIERYYVSGPGGIGAGAVRRRRRIKRRVSQRQNRDASGGVQVVPIFTPDQRKIVDQDMAHGGRGVISTISVDRNHQEGGKSNGGVSEIKSFSPPRPYGNSTIANNNKDSLSMPQVFGLASNDLSNKLKNSFSTIERSKLARQLIRSPSAERKSGGADNSTSSRIIGGAGAGAVQRRSSSSTRKPVGSGSSTPIILRTPQLPPRRSSHRTSGNHQIYPIYPADSVAIANEPSSHDNRRTPTLSRKPAHNYKPINNMPPPALVGSATPVANHRQLQNVSTSDYTQSDMDSSFSGRKSNRKRVQFEDEVADGGGPSNKPGLSGASGGGKAGGATMHIPVHQNGARKPSGARGWRRNEYSD